MTDSPIAQVNALLRSGRHADAAEAARRAIAEGSARGVELAELHNALGTALAQAGDTQAAERAYLAAAAADASLYKPHANLANLYMKRGQAPLAAQRLREAVRLEPKAGRLWARLGQALADQGDAGGARDALERAVEVEDNTAHRTALARLHLAMGAPARAVVLLEKADVGADVEASVTFAEALANAGDPRAAAVIESAAARALSPPLAHALARVAIEAGRLEIALRLVREARAAVGGDAALVTLEVACLEGLGQAAAAIELVEAAFDAAPSIPWVYALSGVAQRTGAAVRSPGVFEAARVLFPDSVDVLVAWGRYARSRRDFDAAYEAFERAASLDPEHAGAAFGLGSVEATLAPGRRAVELLERAARLDPTDPAPFAALLSAELRAGVWPVERRLEGHKSFARRFLHARRLATPAERAPRSGRKLRIGYLSAGFFDQPGARLLLDVLASHDHDRYEIFLYGSVALSDAVTDRFKSLGTYRTILNLSHDAAAAVIANDAIDVLVNLDGHTPGSRLPVLARRPAPVQVSYLGYPASLGADCIDARITDAAADPEGAESASTERLLRLSHTAYCIGRDLPPAPARAPGQAPVFCVFADSADLSAAFLDAAKRILDAAPSARLSLGTPASESKRFRARVAAALGASASRVDFLSPAEDRQARVARYGHVDVALDTFPFAGTASTAEALSSGVPAVTLAGMTSIASPGASMLSAVGLDDCVARTVDEYVDRAVALATDAARLATLRKELRGRVSSSPLGDPVSFTKSLEACLEAQFVDRPSDQRPPGTRVVETDIGARLVVPDTLDTVTTFVIPEQKRWFEDEVPYVRSLLRENDTVVDVGANLGVYTIEAAKIVGPGGKVVAFEPSSSTAAMLRASVAANGLSNVKVFQTALGGRKGEATLLVGSSPELSQLGSGPGPSEVVPIETLGAFDADVRGMAFLKLDAEGTEQEILEAAADLVKREAPVVMFELKHASSINTGLLGAFRRLGFGLYRLCPGPGILVPVRDDEPFDNYCLNLFAVTPARAAELEGRGRLAEAPGKTPEPASPDEIAAWARTRPLLAALALDAAKGSRGGLGYWLRTRKADQPAATRYAALLAAERAAQGELGRSATPAVRLTASRIALDIGRRSRAVEAARGILEGRYPLDPPTHAFACPIPAYEELETFDAERLYVAQAHEVGVRFAAFSSFYQGTSVMDRFRAFYRAGGVSAAMDDRLGLYMARAGTLRR